MVDNLLLSLDNLSTQDGPEMGDVRNDDFDTEKYRLPQALNVPNVPQHRPVQRPRGHTYSSSLSSGYDNYGESPASKYTSSTKGRRSNSNSSFGVPHTNSGRAHTARKLNGPVRSSSDTAHANNGHVHSNSSDLDSIDYGYSSIAETNRQNWAGRRSMSLDHMYTDSATAQSILDRGRPVPSVHSRFESDLDAAPEPMIPAGPRKMQNPTATGPVYVNQAPLKTNGLRKINTQSDLRAASKPSPPLPPGIRDQASDFVRANSMRGVPAIPYPQNHNAPAPSPLFQTTSRKDAPSPQRERPGFFKRVFGSSSNRAGSALSDRSDSHDASLTYQDNVGPPTHSKSRADSSIDASISNQRQTSKEHTPQVSYPPPSLNKKPSSFFRRRKKSTSESAHPPPLPFNSSLNVNVKSAEPSPSVSSLRKVMDPFLSTNGTPANGTLHVKKDDLRPPTQESMVEDSDSLDMFHSGYTPPPDASLGKRDPMSRQPSSKAEDSNEYGDGPKVKLKVKKRNHETVPSSASAPALPPSQNFSDNGFLHDESREPSTATIGELFTPPPDQPKVSPVNENPPVVDETAKERPVSRASTGDRIIASVVNTPIEPSEEMRSFSAANNVSINLLEDSNDDTFVIPPRPSNLQDRPGSKKSEHARLVPTEDEDRRGQRHDSTDTLSAMEGSRNVSHSESQDACEPASPKTTVPGIYPSMNSPDTPSTRFHSATSLPLVQVEGNEVRKSTDFLASRTPSAMSDDGAEYRARARKIYEGDEEDVIRSEAASWLGEKNTLSERTLRAYMQLFDFAGLNILAALRALCGKVLLKGETQQFDRIITALSARWCECNPNHGFKAQDVVHTICYSLILLNTDLHMADIGEKMSRTAYVKNTLPTIRRVVADAAPNAFDDTIKPSPQNSRPSLPWIDSTSSMPTSPTLPPPEHGNERASFENERPAAYKRLSIRPGTTRTDSDGWAPDPNHASNALVKSSWNGPVKGWESELETVLKAFFSSIRNEPLPLMGGPALDSLATDRNLSTNNFGGLKRSGSVVSKAPSDNMSYRSKPGFRTMTMGWQGRHNRSRPKLYPSSTLGSSRTSLEGSMSSPAPSSVWTKNSIAKTLTSASVGSLGQHFSPPTVSDYKHSIGFANALSQAIIREEAVGSTVDDASILMPGNLLEDEGMALEGAPWAKEGLVKHKHHLETPDRKAKERSWSDVFAVISKGKLTLFNFNSSTKSMGRKGGRAAAATKGLGGGDWMENAEQVECFILRQTIASTLPQPGYSKVRPYVWALSLPTGAVHLFQVGTPQIAKEFMTTANYWSARLSKEPLSGSVSNIEYGWSDQVINTALIERTESFASPPPSTQNSRTPTHMTTASAGNMPRPSFQSSIRGSFDTGFGNGKVRLPGDKAQIAEWHPPSQSMMASQLLEVDQLKALQAYVGEVEADLAKHNEVRHAIELAVSAIAYIHRVVPS